MPESQGKLNRTKMKPAIFSHIYIYIYICHCMFIIGLEYMLHHAMIGLVYHRKGASSAEAAHCGKQPKPAI